MQQLMYAVLLLPDLLTVSSGMTMRSVSSSQLGGGDLTDTSSDALESIRGGEANCSSAVVLELRALLALPLLPDCACAVLP